MDEGLKKIDKGDEVVVFVVTFGCKKTEFVGSDDGVCGSGR